MEEQTRKKCQEISDAVQKEHPKWIRIFFLVKNLVESMDEKETNDVFAFLAKYIFVNVHNQLEGFECMIDFLTTHVDTMVYLESGLINEIIQIIYQELPTWIVSSDASSDVALFFIHLMNHEYLCENITVSPFSLGLVLYKAFPESTVIQDFASRVLVHPCRTIRSMGSIENRIMLLCIQFMSNYRTSVEFIIQGFQYLEEDVQAMNGKPLVEYCWENTYFNFLLFKCKSFILNGIHEQQILYFLNRLVCIQDIYTGIIYRNVFLHEENPLYDILNFIGDHMTNHDDPALHEQRSYFIRNMYDSFIFGMPPKFQSYISSPVLPSPAYPLREDLDATLGIDTYGDNAQLMDDIPTPVSSSFMHPSADNPDIATIDTYGTNAYVTDRLAGRFLDTSDSSKSMSGTYTYSPLHPSHVETSVEERMPTIDSLLSYEDLESFVHCPVSGELLDDAIILPTGVTISKISLEKCRNETGDGFVCPQTNVPFQYKDVRPNHLASDIAMTFLSNAIFENPADNLYRQICRYLCPVISWECLNDSVVVGWDGNSYNAGEFHHMLQDIPIDLDQTTLEEYPNTCIRNLIRVIERTSGKTLFQLAGYPKYK
jgi:hypothetical protein